MPKTAAVMALVLTMLPIVTRHGITKRTVREGDWVRIWASPSRNPKDSRVRLRRIERRADHWSWGQNR